MKLKAVWLTTLGLSTLVIVAAVPLNKAASQLWNPDVAHAAKVTANLWKGKQLRPLLTGRRSRVTTTFSQPSTGKRVQPQRMRSEPLT